jgi:HlyD family secretion protein
LISAATLIPLFLRFVELAPRLLPMALVSCLSAAWAIYPGVAVKVEGSAVFLQPDSRLGVYARSAGQVQAVLTQVGQGVRQGEVLLTLDRIDQAAPGKGFVAANPDALGRQERAIDRQEEAARAQIAAIQTTNQPVFQQLKALETLRKQEVIPRYSPLWVGAQDLYLRNQSQVKALEGQLAALDASRAELEGQRLSQAVVAPRSGLLLSLSVAPGQALIPGQRVGTIGPGPNPQRGMRKAVALFGDADATRLRVGQRLQLEPLLQTRDRYGGSAQRYGVVEGKIAAITPASADPSEVSRVLGDPDLAVSLMTRSRQAAFGEGGDPVATTGDKITTPVVIVTVELEPASTPSGLSWSGGPGPNLALENGTPAKAQVTVERRSLVSFVMPFLRWIGGSER